MSEKQRIESRLEKDYGISIKFTEEIKATDDIYVQIYAEDKDIKSCTEFETKDHSLKLRMDGFYECPDCGRVFEKLNRDKTPERN